MTRSAPAEALQSATKSGTGQLRTDVEPVLKRFPLLGKPQGLRWMSGTLGDARVPGPSTYWIDVVADLPTDHAAWLRQTYALPSAAGNSGNSAAAPPLAAMALTDGKPDVTPELRALLAAGGWQGSHPLDSALSQQGFVVRAFMREDRLVLLAVGQ